MNVFRRTQQESIYLLKGKEVPVEPSVYVAYRRINARTPTLTTSKVLIYGR